MEDYTEEEKEIIARRFAEKIYNQMVDMSEEFLDIIDHNYWKLL
jgi:hypothetical protein